MNKVLLVLIALLTFASASFLRTNSHNYWYTAQKGAVKSAVPLSDIAWNYCDFKCLYLEHYYPTYDFVFITFTQSAFKPDFGACYVVKPDATGAKSYAPWTTVEADPKNLNAWYNKYCGQETEDYYLASLGASAKYKVTKTEGDGKNAQVEY